ncbi:DUF4198 domain-containing protein [Thermodesulforhabdus norvegica]|uniref:Nickel transport protein n=1 Tax=Thermodesulforhabdus norvegica TaxID=39841 RepID=A0A1I4T6E4_9BACT|nr:DUF4198 domain-containing protein [Thermodesulforhabdus norvegica]SFM72324.1 nickel transport protein [Thermodesulforhabdus norvegica]
MVRMIISSIVIMLLGLAQVSAHDAWFEPNDGKFVILYGHGEELESYDISKIKEVKAHDGQGNGTVLDVKKREDGKAVVAPPDNTVMLTMVFDNGFWVKTEEGWKNVSKRNVGSYLESCHSMKFAKHIIDWSPVLTNAVGLKMEIVPLKNPMSLKTGEVLQVKVLLDGKPVEGVTVATGGGHKSGMTTNNAGIVDVLIEKPGFQFISASYRVPLRNNPDADELLLSSNLTFYVE